MSSFKEIIIIFELFDCFLITLMLFFDLLFCVKIYFDIDVINDIASVLIVPLRMRKNASIVRDMELIDQYLNYFLRIFLEVNDKLALFFP